MIKHLAATTFAAGISGASFIAYAGEVRISATGTQNELCDVTGIKTLHSGNGYSVDLFASRNTTPSIVVSLNGRQCYADLVAGEGDGFNVKYNGVTYHTQRPRYIPTFFFKPATTSTKYSFTISAAGQFDIEWGDGQVETVIKTGTAVETISHNYERAANTYEISLGGRATAYSTASSTAAISFDDSVCAEGSDTCTSEYGLSSMRGCLGCVFSTLADKSQPRFYKTFRHNTLLSSAIPSQLFNGITGEPVDFMFANLFEDCRILAGPIPGTLFAGLDGAPKHAFFNNLFLRCYNLSGDIPEELFAGIKGAPAATMFNNAFQACRNLTGKIPPKLFAGINGAPAARMYSGLFMESGVSGEIPDGLFGRLDGAPAANMFEATFKNCKNLTGDIPADLFKGITPTDSYKTDMFKNTFYNSVNLTGYSPKINGQYLYEIWTPDTPQETFYNDTKLNDWANMPDNWK